MNKNAALKAAGGVFLLISLAQLSRVIFRFPAVIGNTEVPIGLNAAALVVFLSLSVWMFRASK